MAASVYLPDEAGFVLVFLRVHFSGGSGSANIIIGIDAYAGPAWDCELYTIESAGTGGLDVNLRVLSDELPHWVFQPRDRMTVTWTNPDSGNMLWGLQAGIAKV